MPTRLAILIKARRRTRGLSVEDLAALIDCESSTIRRWERDGAVPAGRHMRALRAALGIPLPDLDAACLESMIGAPAKLRIEGTEHLARTGKSIEAFTAELLALDARNLRIEDPRDLGAVEQWAPIFEAMPDTWRLLTLGEAIIGYWHLLPLTREALSLVRAGKLRDGGIDWERIELIAFPGRYHGYLSSFVADPPYRYGKPFQAMVDSLVDTLARLAEGGVLFEEMLTPGFTREGRKLLDRLGFACVGAYAGRADIPLYETTTAALLARPEFARCDYLRGFYTVD